MNTNIMPELLKLSASERLQIIGELWDSLPGSPNEIPLTKAQLAEIDRRLERSKNPNDVVSWESVKAETLYKGMIFGIISN